MGSLNARLRILGLVVIFVCLIFLETLSMAEPNNQVMRVNTINYKLGRFVIDIPETMKLAAQKFIFNFATIKEIAWKDKNKFQQERDIAWKSKLEEVAKLPPPRRYKKHPCRRN